VTENFLISWSPKSPILEISYRTEHARFPTKMIDAFRAHGIGIKEPGIRNRSPIILLVGMIDRIVRAYRVFSLLGRRIRRSDGWSRSLRRIATTIER